MTAPAGTQPQCTAKAKTTGQQCTNRAMIGKTKCRMHGGKSRSGPAHPNWIDGRGSRVMPKRMMQDYQDALNDPEKLAFDKDIALLEARLRDVLKRVDSGESGRLWGFLASAWDQYEAARRANDPQALLQAIALIGDLIRQGHGDHLAWAEVTNLLERRRKVVESEMKRQVQMHEVVKSEVAMGLLAQLVQAVREHVHDDDTVQAITAEYARLIGA